MTETANGVKALIAGLKDPDPYVRGESARLLGRLDPAGEDVISALVQALRDRARLARAISARALGSIGRAAVAAVPALIRAVADEDWQVRANSAWALGRMGPAAKEAVPALIKALEDKASGVWASSVDALVSIGPDADAVRSLVAALKNEAWVIRAHAAFILGTMGAAANEAVPALLAAVLNDEHPSVRRESRTALRAIGLALD